MDGLELLAQVASLYPGLQSIVISGQEEVDSAVKALELGAGRYLRKPVQLQELLIACRRAVAQSRLMAEVADKQRMQLRLQQAQKLEAVGQLAAGIAHEINTPTQYVSTNIDFFKDAFTDICQLVEQLQLLMTRAREEQQLGPEVQAAEKLLEEVDWPYLAEEIPTALKQSKDGVRRVTDIVRAMKEFSHPGSKEKTMVDINHLIETTVTVARNEWKYVSEVRTELQHDLPMVFCLAGEVSQVLLNVLVNGAQAIAAKLGDTPTGDKGEIVITTKVAAQSVVISCQDSGCGMSEEVKQRIFEPFFTTKGVGKGTGQGLAIAWDVVVHKHGGSLWLETREGEGSTFNISLPLGGDDE